MTVIRERNVDRANGYDFETRWLLGPWNGTKSLEFGTIVFQPGESTPLHYHREIEEIFYVINGKLTLRLGSDVEHLEAGCAVHIPPRITHQGRNESTRPVKFVVVKSPHRANDKIIVKE